MSSISSAPIIALLIAWIAQIVWQAVSSSTVRSLCSWIAIISSFHRWRADTKRVLISLAMPTLTAKRSKKLKLQFSHPLIALINSWKCAAKQKTDWNGRTNSRRERPLFSSAVLANAFQHSLLVCLSKPCMPRLWLRFSVSVKSTKDCLTVKAIKLEILVPNVGLNNWSALLIDWIRIKKTNKLVDEWNGFSADDEHNF